MPSGVKTLKLVFDARVLEVPVTGIAKSCFYLYDACLRLRPELGIAGLHQGKLWAPRNCTLSVSRVAPLLPQRWWPQYAFSKIIRQNRADIVHFPWNGKLPSRRLPCPVIVTIHDVLPLEIPDYFQSGEKEKAFRRELQQSIDNADLVIMPSEYSRRQLLQNFRVNREPVVISHGPTLTMPPRAAPGEEKGYFLYVGGYDRRKGIVELLRVFLRLAGVGQLRSRLVLTGAPSYFSQELKDLIEQGSQEGVVEEKGYVSDEELAELYRSALALIYPSRYEGFGLPVLEAMTGGCPVITTACTSLPEVCGDAALYIDPAREEDFAEAIRMIEKDVELRRRLSSEGLRRAALFSWEKSALLFLKEMDQVIAGWQLPR